MASTLDCVEGVFHGVVFLQVGDVNDVLNSISPLGPVTSQYPQTFEDMKQVRCPSGTVGQGIN